MKLLLNCTSLLISQRLESGSKSPLYTLFSTTVGGLTSIRAFRANDFFESKNNDFLDDSQGPFFFRFSGMLFLRVTLTWMTVSEETLTSNSKSLALTRLRLLQALLAIGLSILAVALRSSTSSALLGVALSQLTSLGQTLMAVSMLLCRLCLEFRTDLPLFSQTLMNYASVENSVVVRIFVWLRCGNLQQLKQSSLPPSVRFPGSRTNPRVRAVASRGLGPSSVRSFREGRSSLAFIWEAGVRRLLDAIQVRPFPPLSFFLERRA